MKLKYFKVDSFTNELFKGNPENASFRVVGR